MAGPVVVKFGGGLVAAPERDALLDLAARAGAIVAPGGGAFADEVRAAQKRLRFSDEAAHAMAILAMDQTALLLADATPSLTLCDRRGDFQAAAARARGAIWRPSPMALAADLPASWNVTSDSLALWLAIELGAPRLVILKAAEVDGAADLATLAAAGIVDAHVPILARGYRGEILVLGPATAAALDDALARGERRAA